MIIRTAYVRFYRAFNFDYLRKWHPGANPAPWDLIDDTFYPYVRLNIDPELTAVVGANESGKSQILLAIECALGLKEPSPADFCRYSDHFTVAEAMKIPHFGLHFEDVKDEEAQAISQLVGSSDIGSMSSFRVFRTHPSKAMIYVGKDGYEVADLPALGKILPRALRINPDRAIPNSVPISYLADGDRQANADLGPSRTDRWKILGPIVERLTLWSQQNDQPLSSAIQSILPDASALGNLSDQEKETHHSQLDLAYDLLVTVGGIHISAFDELQQALRRADEGLVTGIEASMNGQLEESLNLAKWWSQDKRFRLAITVRDFDIVFTIRDRTGSAYSFAERSDGLKYFLSYLVQFLVHVKGRVGPEILLMDEPDAYLSNQGQQDLLRVLREFTLPTEAVPGGQVVFVTHSPFLIDKNRGDRIRVLDKGSGEEGVRVVRDVGRNHFEPLRTALGGFVGETAFIGNCNLMLEGLADQVYLAGMSELLNRADVASTERLDLNRITLVPAGSASHVPYMTFLARGRDTNKPAVIVLLDGDEEGDRAAEVLQEGGPRNKQLIQPKYVIQLKSSEIPGITSDRPGGPLDIEDLIPVEIGLNAVKEYLRELGIEEPDKFPSVEDIKALLSESTGVFKAIEEALDQTGSELHLDKLGFARNVVAVYSRCSSASAGEMRTRFVALFTKLTTVQREAERERERESIAARVARETALFIRDRPTTATKADVVMMLERIKAVIDGAVEGDDLLSAIRRTQEEFKLDHSLSEQIPDYAKLKDWLKKLKYAELHASQSKKSS